MTREELAAQIALREAAIASLEAARRRSGLGDEPQARVRVPKSKEEL